MLLNFLTGGLVPENQAFGTAFSQGGMVDCPNQLVAPAPKCAGTRPGFQGSGAVKPTHIKS